MEAHDLALALGMMEWHAILHCPQNDLLSQTLDLYALTHQLTETIAVPGNLSINERRAMIDTLLVLRRSWWLLWSLHRRGLCLGGRFSAINFIIYSDLSVRLNDIMVMELVNKEVGDLDYFEFVKVILDQVFVQEQIPRGVLRWLRLISNGMEGYGYLIAYHNSMMESHQAVESHMSLYSKFLELETTDNQLFWDIISALNQYDGWQGRNSTCTSTLLNDTRIFVNPSGHRIRYENDVRGILKLARNCWQHRALYHEGFFTVIVAQDFPWLFADFQEAMHDAGLVVQLHLEACMR